MTAVVRTTLIFSLNGEKVEITNPDPSSTLNDYIRSTRFTGTKLACGEGGCGACAVLVATLNPATGRVCHATANSCLRPLCSLDGTAVTTTEGLGCTATGLHPVQERIAGFNGSQCGFCTPGMVVSIAAALRRADDDGGRAPTAAELEGAIDGCVAMRARAETPRHRACPATAADRSETNRRRWSTHRQRVCARSAAPRARTNRARATWHR